MKHHWLRLNIFLLMVGGLLIIQPVGSFASGASPRGQFPECQEECLKKHNDMMHRLAEEYKTTGNKRQYQDAVKVQGQEYERCLENCRLRYPVK